MISGRALFGLLFALVTNVPAFAHDPGLSSAQIERTTDGLEIQLTFAWSDLVPLISGASSERPSTASLAGFGSELTRSTAGVVSVYVNNVIQPAAGLALSPVASSASEVTVLIKWARISSGVIRLEFPVLGKLPFGHRMVLTSGDSGNVIALLDARHVSCELPVGFADAMNAKGDSTVVARSGWTGFVLLGVEHILTGFDHLCFLFALLIVAVRLREVLAVVTTFTVAHSLTLAAAATGVVSLSPRVVEPLIAASIVYIGIENLFFRRPPRYRLAVVFGFGLVHGLGFASALAERLPGVTGAGIIPPLLGFNAGVELGQLAVAACLVPLIRLGRSRPAFIPRWQPAFSLMIAAAGVIWFCQRV